MEMLLAATYSSSSGIMRLHCIAERSTGNSRNNQLLIGGHDIVHIELYMVYFRYGRPLSAIQCGHFTGRKAAL